MFICTNYALIIYILLIPIPKNYPAISQTDRQQHEFERNSQCISKNYPLVSVKQFSIRICARPSGISPVVQVMTKKVQRKVPTNQCAYIRVLNKIYTIFFFCQEECKNFVKTHVTALLCTTKKFLILNRYTQCGEVTLKIKKKRRKRKKEFSDLSSLFFKICINF